jgi:hypothetical protein
MDETWPRVLPWFIVRVICSVLFPFFLILVMEDVIWSSVLLPHTCFLLSCMHSMVETKNISSKIYIDKDRSTCGILIY